jgi:hypothetical protein
VTVHWVDDFAIEIWGVIFIDELLCDLHVTKGFNKFEFLGPNDFNIGSTLSRYMHLLQLGLGID